ncbi:MAG: FtsL-like putative cell division protein [Bacteroidota bacterium]
MGKPKTISDYLTLDFSAEAVIKNLPFVLFLGFIGLIYIMNAHYSEKKLYQIQKYQEEIEELKWEYNSIKADLMYATKQSEVTKVVKEIGLKNAPSSPPKRIIIEKKK